MIDLINDVSSIRGLLKCFIACPTIFKRIDKYL